MHIFLLFLLVPLIEIGLFIVIGEKIGLWLTLLTVVVTAVIGAFLVRIQGLRALNNLRGSINSLSNPAEPLAHGAMILFSGALLMTPGFFTDAIGFILLVPQFRGFLMRQISARVTMAQFTYGETSQSPEDGDVVDGEFEELTKDHKPTHQSSGWTRH